MSDTPLTDDIARGNHVVPTDFAQDLERERGQWRECAENLARALRKEWKVRSLICYGDALKALADFDRLKESKP